MGNAKQLLGTDRQEPYKTGEVLELEFKLIHGAGKWDPPDPAPAAAEPGASSEAIPELGRAEYLENAKKHLPNDPAEAQRLALHAWSVKNLRGCGQAALCLSGGGIRSAAFALGILQGLARRNLLLQFQYLSTVSGGGYIGSWLTAWRHRVGDDPVLQCLQGREFGEFTEPAPLQRLRSNQAFLTPKVGLVSVDTWTAAAVPRRSWCAKPKRAQPRVRVQRSARHI